MPETTFQKNIIRIVISSKKEHGSGIIYLPKEHPDKAYIFIAFHCIAGATKGQIEIQKIYNPKLMTFESYRLQDDSTHQILHFEGEEIEKDIAILVMPRTAITNITGDLDNVNCLNDRFDLKDCLSIGYPLANDENQLTLDAELRIEANNSPFRFEAKTEPHENLTTLNDDGYASVVGMSGGGLFLVQNEHKYLLGILIKYPDNYKHFVCIKLPLLSQLLQNNGYGALPFVFDNALGMNEAWFKKHTDDSVRDLGERYTKALPNFDLPITQIFHGIARDKAFFEKVRHKFDILLSGFNENESSVYSGIFEKVKTDSQYFKQVFETTKWAVGGRIDVDILVERASFLNRILYDSMTTINRLSYEDTKDIEKSDDKYKIEGPFNSISHHTRKLLDALSSFREFIGSPMFSLAETPCLLLRGKAGYGKSHLLGDISQTRIQKGLPTILILGNKLLTKENVWKQILNDLQIDGTKDNFLKTLNNVGKYHNSRVLFMIDALNEGEGKNFWQTSIASFINDFKQYPYIGLVMSIRDTYYNLIPDDLKNNKQIIEFEHKGFEGFEMGAVKHFCHYFKLEQPRFPLLSPEFSNPQFLLLLCRSLRDNGNKTIPEGLNGITAIYEFYTQSINRKLIESGNYQHSERFNLVQKAIEYWAEKTENNQITTHEKAIEIFNDFTLTPNKNLFWDLLRENVWSEDRNYDYTDDKYKDVVRFTYERFGDHLMAGYLLEKYFTPEVPKQAFQKEGYFYDLFKGNFWKHKGILEALAIQLPEKFGVEIFEAFPQEFQTKRANENDFTSAFIESLRWRKTTSIDFEKLRKYVNNVVVKGQNGNYFWKTILFTAPIPNHPFNSDSFHRNLINRRLPQRDAWLITFTNYEFGELTSPVSRLIDWAWSNEDNSQLYAESVRLTSQILAWFLVSPNKILRDSTTIALVNLLENHLPVLIQTLKAFEKVDDMYVSERLYAVAYGCAMRSDNTEGVTHLAQYVYDTIFKNGNPPVHFLLRDYARGILELALHRGLKIKGIEINKIRPPYGSLMPDNIPSKEDVRKYRIENDTPQYNANPNAARGQNSIEYSVLSWDFNRYVISSYTNDFINISFTQKEIYKDFKKTLKSKPKSILGLFEQSFDFVNQSDHRKNNCIVKMGQPTFDKWEIMMNETLEMTLNQLKEYLSDNDFSVFKSKIIPYLKSVSLSKDWQRSSFQYQPIARWILQRVFELGYDGELHGEFDSSHRSQSRNDSKVERIGKKYQWIAFHEIMARIADNYYLKDHNNKLAICEGAFQPRLRDIDPSLTVKSWTEKATDEESTPEFQPTWWFNQPYDKWHIDKWVRQKEDLPDPKNILSVKDSNGEEWLSLLTFPSWKSPKEVGDNTYDSQWKNIWYHLRAYIVKQSDAKATFEWLKKQDFNGRWLPEERNRYEMFSREFYWSHTYRFFDTEYYSGGKKIWKQFRGSNFKGLITAEDYSAGGGSYTVQNSVRASMPSKYIFDRMNLKFGAKDGEFVNEKGEVICFDPSVNTPSKSFLLIKKEPFLAFLNANKLALCWTILGEKIQKHKREGREKYDVFVINGACLLNKNGEIEGDFNIRNRDKKA
jgi:hypothetical protein